MVSELPDKHVCRQSVQAAPAESFYSHPHMGPYQFFDCAHGKHESRGGASLFNKARMTFAHSSVLMLMASPHKNASKSPTIALLVCCEQMLGHPSLIASTS